MTERQHEPRFGPVFPALWMALCTFCAYMGAYYVTVVPYIQKLGPGYYYSIGDYRLPYETYAFFSPAHWIDRHLRSEPWATQATGQSPRRNLSPAHR
jgi:hypothetical protein